MTWDEFTRDLHLTHTWSDTIHVFSLEGAVRQGYLSRLLTFDWDAPVTPPLREFRQVERLRKVLRAVLWASVHPGAVLAGALVFFWLSSRLMRKKPQRRQ